MSSRATVNPIGISASFDQPGDDFGFFAINRTDGQPQIQLTVPVTIMHRLYRLGQAYDLPRPRELSSDSRLVFPGKESHRLAKMLRRVIKLTNDDELHGYAGELASVIESQEPLTISSIAVKTGHYHDERR